MVSWGGWPSPCHCGAAAMSLAPPCLSVGGHERPFFPRVRGLKYGQQKASETSELELLALPPQPVHQLPPSIPTGSLQNLPIYFIHGMAASPQPAVAAVAHKGQDGVFVCDGLHHELQVEQAAVGGGYNCKRFGSVSLVWSLLKAKTQGTRWEKIGGRKG